MGIVVVVAAEDDKSKSISEPSLGVHKDFLIFFGGSINSYEHVSIVFCISEPEERVHRNKIIIFIFFLNQIIENT